MWAYGRGWVQRKTNKAYRIDRRNPEHVRSLLLYTSLLTLADVPPSSPSPLPLPYPDAVPKPSSMS